jgi:hypothetical protein
MAEDISGKIKGKPGRPPKNAQEAVRTADSMVGGAFAKNGARGPSQGFGGSESSVGDPGGDLRTAPAFGHNEPTVGVFLKHVQAINAHALKIEEAKLKLKALKGQMKDLREAAKSEGVVLGELDRALKDSSTENVDLEARERRYLLYMEWLGKPLGVQGEIEPVQEVDDRVRWYKAGDQAGRLGKARDAYPEGIPPELKTDYCAGWDHGQTMLMKSSPLTSAAFKAPVMSAFDGVDRNPAAAVLTLREEHFQAGIDLEDANRSTIFDDDILARFDAAANVIVVFGDRKRLLKEPGYVDDGSDDTPITDPQPITTAQILQ